MNQHNDPLDKLFESSVKPDPQVKKATMNAAMAAFDEEITTADQGFFQRQRLTFTQFFKGRNTMSQSSGQKPLTNAIKNKLLYSGLVGFSVAAVGVFFIMDQQGQTFDDSVAGTNYAPAPVAFEPELQEGPKGDALGNHHSRRETNDKNQLVEQKVARQNKGDSVITEESTVALSDLAPQVVARSAPTEKPEYQDNKKKSQRPSKDDDRTLTEESTVVGRSALDENRENFKANYSIIGTEKKVAAPQAIRYKRLSTLDKDQVLADSVSVMSADNDQLQAVETGSVKQVVREPVSTFSIDVDTASYSHTRRLLNQGRLPQSDAVRIEEMVNYFDYQYPVPESKATPFGPTVIIHPAPWAEGKKLVHIGIKGFELDSQQQPDSNLVLLLDVSGSMNAADKLPLVKQSMELLLSTLKPTDTVSIVVYAGASGQVLAPTKVSDKNAILGALNNLSAGGSTAGGQGIELAYKLAQANFNDEAVNRIILATDGDFNVGVSNPDDLKRLVERKRNQGVFLSVLGFGQGNYNDHIMQSLAQNGNGVAAYIDSLSEAQKVLVNEATSTLFTIAGDVKIQVEFNPKMVSEYRLIGYETRALKQEDFNNDKVDAGDIGAGHSVTAIYEITPFGSNEALIDPSRYSEVNTAVNSDASSEIKTQKNTVSNEYGFLKLRYKLPGQSKSILLSTPIIESTVDTSPGLISDINFATAVAAFGQLLRGGQYTGDYSYDDIITLAQANKGADIFGYRTEFIQLVRKAKIAK